MLTGQLFKYISGGLAIALLIFIGLWKMEQRRAGKLATRVTELTELRESDRKSYEAAQREAQAKNKATVQKIEAEQKEITADVTSDLNSRLERIRRELRAQGSAAGGSSEGPGAGKTSQAPCVVNDPSWLCLTPEQRLRGAENEERHDQLITWVERQSRVEP